MTKEEQKALMKAINEDNLDEVRNLLDNTNLLEGECTINDVMTYDSNGAQFTLLTHSQSRYNPNMVQAFLEKGADPNLLDGLALFNAVRAGNIPIVDLLCRTIADVNFKNFDGSTPLFEAVFRDDINMINILISYDADPNCRVTTTSKIYGREEKHYSSFSTLQSAINRGYQNKDYTVALSLIEAGANVNQEWRHHDLRTDGSVIDESICYKTPLYEAMEYASYQNSWSSEAIPLVCTLLKAGADSGIPVRDHGINDDTAFGLAIRSNKPELIEAIRSTLFQQDSSMALHNIVNLTFELFKHNGEMPTILLQYFAENDLGSSTDYIDKFREKLSEAEHKGENVFKSLVKRPNKLHKLLKIIQKQFPEALDILPEQILQNNYYDILTEIIRMYSEKYTQRFPNHNIETDKLGVGIKGELKAYLISFLPLEKQWNTIMLSTEGLESNWTPEQKAAGLSSAFEQCDLGN